MEQQKSLVEIEGKASRPLAYFPTGNAEDPSILSSVTDIDPEAQKAYEESLRSLKEKAKALFTASKANAIENIKFIDTLCRLGVSYHFEKEIEIQLDNIFASRDFHHILRDDACDLHTVGLAFQVFRQFGFKLSLDVFDKFKDGDRKFKEHLGGNVMGMLSLYEAAQWSTPGEDVLDDALFFSRTHLEGLVSRCSPHLAVRIKNALKFPYHKGITRIEARQYISYYEEDEMHDETLLTFAKVDFNVVQLQHREELAYISRWYSVLKIESKIPYIMHRVVEAYVWAAVSLFRPQYSHARIILTTVIILVTILDDTYDAYATLEELELFTNAIDSERDNFDVGDFLINAPEELPASMKHSYRIMIDFYDKLEKELEHEGRIGCAFHVKKTFRELAKRYYGEAKWLDKNYTASFDEYLSYAHLSSSCYMLVAASYVGMADVAKLEAFQWLSSYPKLLVAAGKIWRFMDDVVGHEIDHQRKHVGTAIDCYMKQYGVSKEKARKEIEKIISQSWKEVNQELMRPHSLPYPILVHLLNLTRVCEVTYKYSEGYTEPESLKDHILSLFANQIPILTL